ncbi:MAG: hypothetical protein F2667_12845 [Actinobacteria bacterium]|uniref:Unannotated protein n=1 Tax=freshwater metagenome TaxID=449393 RepID=A0A6J6S281_9ZZZZ|nr:hypothetical protein [Actinomycetota bacterium]
MTTVSARQPFAWDPAADLLSGPVGKRVTQCALSRVCGGCGEPLGRPIAFVGTPLERDRNAFHFPPMHAGCAADLLARLDALEPGSWLSVQTAGFEFVRANREDLDRRPTFEPNSLL